MITGDAVGDHLIEQYGDRFDIATPDETHETWRATCKMHEDCGPFETIIALEMLAQVRIHVQEDMPRRGPGSGCSV
jgi:hypothetical protein